MSEEKLVALIGEVKRSNVLLQSILHQLQLNYEQARRALHPDE